MLFFRSEGDLNRWLASRQAERGATFSIQKLWELSQRWYQDRISPGYHGRTAEDVQKIFTEAGLTSKYWQPG